MPPRVFGLDQLADAVGRVHAPGGDGPASLDSDLAVAGPDSLTWDVAAPCRRGTSAARVCANEIDEALASIMSALSGIPVLGGLGVGHARC